MIPPPLLPPCGVHLVILPETRGEVTGSLHRTTTEGEEGSGAGEGYSGWGGVWGGL